MKDEIQLSDHFTHSRLIRFVMPSIAMMIFSSIYGVVDGFFVSNYVGVTGFAAVNLGMPIIMLMSCLGFMFGSGGTAIVSKTFGEGDPVRANRYFSLICYSMMVIGVFIAVASIFVMPAIADFLGAEGLLREYVILYGRITMLSTPFYMMQTASQYFFAAAEEPKVGMYVTVAAGVANIVLDYLLVGVMNYGLVGAAIATCASETLGGIISIIYFLLPNRGILHIGACSWRPHVLVKSCTNGVSELMNSISQAVVGVICNFQLMRFGGENGVAAYGVIMYVGFFFVSIFIGYAIGSAPIIGYNYGADNAPEQNNVFRQSLNLIGIAGIMMALLSHIFAPVFASIFVGYNDELFNMTVNGMKIYMMSFLISGFNIFASSFFTALSNGGVSAIIAVLRSFVFQSICLIVMPKFLEINGVWAAPLVSEALTLVVSVIFVIRLRGRYNYWDNRWDDMLPGWW